MRHPTWLHVCKGWRTPTRSSSARVDPSADRCGIRVRGLGKHTLKGIVEPVQRMAGDRPQPDRRALRSQPRSGFHLPHVARDEELALVLRRWEQASDGEGQVVLSPANRGSERAGLCRRCASASARQPHTRQRYQCSALSHQSALHPVVEALATHGGLRARGQRRNESSTSSRPSLPPPARKPRR